MKMTIKMPRVGETVDEVYLLDWSKKVGDRIEVGESLGEVETDKASTFRDAASIVSWLRLASKVARVRISLQSLIRLGRLFCFQI
jgi:hypothetical protein